MRHVKIIVGLIAAACACGISATSALAQPVFEASKEGKFKSYNTKEELLKQTFTIGPIKYENASHEPVEAEYSIKCETAKGSGEAPFPSSPTLTVDIKYEKCFTSGSEPDKTNGATFVKPLPEFEYNADGSVTIVEPIVVKLKESKCTVTIESQTLEAEPEKGKPYEPVKFSNAVFPKADKTKAEKEDFPEGTQTKLLIENEITPRNIAEKEEEPEIVGLAYEIEPTKETIKGECAKIPAEDREGENGSYKGDLHLELKNGSLKIS